MQNPKGDISNASVVLNWKCAIALTDAADPEPGGARSRGGAAEVGAVGGAVARAVGARRREARVVVEPHDREQRQNWKGKRDGACRGSIHKRKWSSTPRTEA